MLNISFTGVMRCSLHVLQTGPSVLGDTCVATGSFSDGRTTDCLRTGPVNLGAPAALKRPTAAILGHGERVNSSIWR
jgi:hypothetical protein